MDLQGHQYLCSSEPSRALEIPQTRKELTMVSCEMESHAMDTQLMASWRVGCFKFPCLVFARSWRIHSCQLCRILSLNGLLMHLSIGWMIEVHPPGTMTTPALQRSFAILMLSSALWGL